jgi:hypothetical protein
MARYASYVPVAIVNKELPIKASRYVLVTAFVGLGF